MWTGFKENSEYSAQITPFRGYVHAEIICKNKDNGFYDYKLNLWLVVLYKSFGRMFSNEPREIDYQRANDWVNKHLSMIEKYGTAVVTIPQHLRDAKNYEENINK